MTDKLGIPVPEMIFGGNPTVDVSQHEAFWSKAMSRERLPSESMSSHLILSIDLDSRLLQKCSEVARQQACSSGNLLIMHISTLQHQLPLKSHMARHETVFFLRSGLYSIGYLKIFQEFDHRTLFVPCPCKFFCSLNLYRDLLLQNNLLFLKHF